MIIKAEQTPNNQQPATNTNNNNGTEAEGASPENSHPLFSLCDSTSSNVQAALNKDAPVFTPGSSTGFGLTGQTSGSGGGEFVVTSAGGLAPHNNTESSFVLTNANSAPSQPVVGGQTLVVVPAPNVAFPQNPQTQVYAGSSGGQAVPAPSFMAGASRSGGGGSAGSQGGSSSNMSLQNQMLAQFSPQLGVPFVPSPASTPAPTSNNVAGRRIILGGGGSSTGPSPNGSYGGGAGGSMGNFPGAGFSGSGSASPGAQVGSHSRGASVSSGNNFSGSNYAAAAIGDTENDIKSLLPGAGGKLRDPNDKGPKQCIVKFLAPQVTEQELRQLFQQFGPVEYSRMIYDANTGSSKGYGFVYFYKSGDAADAVKGLDSFELYGRYLRVGFAIPQRQPPAPTGSPTSQGPAGGQ